MGAKIKISREVIEKIRREYDKGKITQESLGRKYGVSKGWVCQILQGVVRRNG